jgi:hypothetical protein
LLCEHCHTAVKKLSKINRYIKLYVSSEWVSEDGKKMKQCENKKSFYFFFCNSSRSQQQQLL